MFKSLKNFWMGAKVCDGHACGRAGAVAAGNTWQCSLVLQEYFQLCDNPSINSLSTAGHSLNCGTNCQLRGALSTAGTSLNCGPRT